MIIRLLVGALVGAGIMWYFGHPLAGAIVGAIVFGLMSEGTFRTFIQR